MRKMRYTKGARYKNNPKREYAITNTKKMLTCTRWGLSRWRVPLEKPGIASLRKKVENLNKAVHFQRGLRAILYKLDLRNIKKEFK